VHGCFVEDEPLDEVAIISRMMQIYMPMIQSGGLSHKSLEDRINQLWHYISAARAA
jgi:hypothetical protein